MFDEGRESAPDATQSLRRSLCANRVSRYYANNIYYLKSPAGYLAVNFADR